MVVSKKIITKKQTIWRYLFGFLLVVIGILLNYFKIGQEFLGFNSIGLWMIYVGFVMFIVITLQYFSKRKKIIDERMEKIGYRSSRIVFLILILGAFIIMIIDGIKPIIIPYHMFMSYMISGIVLIYFVSYKILEKIY